MPTQFQDIRVTGYDADKAYNPNPPMQVFENYVTLSDYAPSEWGELFERAYKSVLSSTYRRLRVSGNTIIVSAPIGEINQELIDRLKECAAQANEEYKKFLFAKEAQENRQAAEEQAQRDRLKEIESKLKF